MSYRLIEVIFMKCKCRIWSFFNLFNQTISSSFSILFEISNKNNELVIMFDKFQFKYKLFNKLVL